MQSEIGGRNPLHTENKKLLVWYRHAKTNLKVVHAPVSTGKARARALFRAWHHCYRRSQTREKIIYSRKKTGKH